MLRFTPARGHFWEFRTRPARRAASLEEVEFEADNVEEEADNELEAYIKLMERKTSVGKKSDPRLQRATPYQTHRTHALLQLLAEQFRDSDDGKSGRPKMTEAEKMVKIYI